jgi:negative regulator of sigma E activity
MEAAKKIGMRHIKLSGREATVVRAIGFTEAMMGAELQDVCHMDGDDVTDTLNSLMSAGFVEAVPYYDEVQLAEMPVTAFELNPAYASELKQALYRR